MKITADDFKSDGASSITDKINAMLRSLGGINYSDSNKVTPLCFAATNGIDSYIIVNLINGKYNSQIAKPNLQCNTGMTPLECAISTGTADPVKALIGEKVPELDEEGNQIETNIPTGKYKLDGAKQPLQVRDENDDVVYREYKGVPIPLNEGEKFVSDKHQQRCMINGKLTYVPPPSYNLTGKFEDCKFSNITYLYEKDGSHKPMKDADGNKLKQCYSNGKEIHKKDDSGKELKNNYEYVWDYKRLPEYQLEYEIKSIYARQSAIITNHAILSASKLSTSEVLNTLIHKWCGCTVNSEGEDVYVPRNMYSLDFLFSTAGFDTPISAVNPFDGIDIDNDTPVYEATNMKCIESVVLLRDHDSAFTQSVNKLNDAALSAATSAINSGDDDLIGTLKDYMLPILSTSTQRSFYTEDGRRKVRENDNQLKLIENAVVNDDFDSEAMSKMIDIYMPLLVTGLYKESFYEKVTTGAHAGEYHVAVDSLYTTSTFDDDHKVTINFPDGKVAIDYLELAVRGLCSTNPAQSTLLNKIKNSFIVDNIAKRVDTDLLLTGRGCYSILNWLHENNKFKYRSQLDDSHDENTVRNRVAIYNAVDNSVINPAKLTSWPWFTDAAILYVENDDRYFFISDKYTLGGEPVTLNNSHSTADYHDASGIWWHPVRWSIGEFGGSYKLEKDVIAKLVCEKVKITLKFDTSEYPELDPIESITDDNGKTITLPEISDTFIDSDGIKWHAKEWIINGSHYNQGSTYVLPYNSNYEITATAVCEKANVTLKFAKTDYQFLDIPGFPSSRTEHSGTIVTLPTLSGSYVYDGHTYTPTTWDIGAFGSSYTLKDDITANLVCEEIIVVTEVVFNDSVTELNEGGSTTRYFKLSSAPNSDVTLHISTDSDRLMISQNTVTFNGGNWDSNQSVTFTAKPNSIADGDITATVTISTTSSDLRYNNQSYTLNPITIKDDDQIGIIYNDSSTSVVLEGNNIVRTIKLKSQPTANVTINLTSNASTRLNISPTQLTFTTGDWSSLKNVTFSANDNYDVDGDVTATVTASCSASYYSFTDNSLHITVKDNDTAGVVYSSGIVIANEGDAVFKSFNLSSKPTSNVTLTFSSNNVSRLGIPNNSITFDSNNWGTSQDVRFNALNNDIDDDTVDVKVTAVISSVDSAYNSLSDISFYIKIIDNDVAGFTFDDTSTITLTEGESITRNVKLNSQPTQPVTITFSFPSSYNDRLSISSVQFNSNDWSDFKPATFEALDNDIADNDISVNITVSASSSDTKYNSLPSTNLVVNVNNDDVASIGTLAFTSGSVPVIFVEDGDMCQAQAEVRYAVVINDLWDAVLKDGYYVQSVPKSPYWTPTAKRFDYDLLYPDSADD